MNSEKGFTLIELLVVVIIIGVLAAISIPTFLAQANKARGAEARTNLGVINRAQAAHFISESEFADNLADLEIGLPNATENYTYAVTSDAASANATAAPNNEQLNGYASAVALGENNQTATILCESDDPDETPALVVGEAEAALACPEGSEQVR